MIEDTERNHLRIMSQYDNENQVAELRCAKKISAKPRDMRIMSQQCEKHRIMSQRDKKQTRGCDMRIMSQRDKKHRRLDVKHLVREPNKPKDLEEAEPRIRLRPKPFLWMQCLDKYDGHIVICRDLQGILRWNPGKGLKCDNGFLEVERYSNLNSNHNLF